MGSLLCIIIRVHVYSILMSILCILVRINVYSISISILWIVVIVYVYSVFVSIPCIVVWANVYSNYSSLCVADILTTHTELYPLCIYYFPLNHLIKIYKFIPMVLICFIPLFYNEESNVNICFVRLCNHESHLQYEFVWRGWLPSCYIW